MVHANLAVPWAGAVDLAGALALPHTRVVAVQQLPLRTVELPTWLRTGTLCTAWTPMWRSARRAPGGLRTSTRWAAGRWCRCLERLRDDGALRARLGAAGRKRALVAYTVEHMAAAYQRLWEQVVTAPRTPRLRPPSACP